MTYTRLHLNIFLPFQRLMERTDVLRIVVETKDGSYGIYPNRLDCVAALSPGILTYETESDGEVFVALDEGVLVKTGQQVLVSVRRAMGGTTLDQLRLLVQREFVALDERERSVRSVMLKLESGFLHRYARFQHE